MSIQIRSARQADRTYIAWCPSLPGCVVRGRTEQVAHEKIRQAVAGYLARLDVALPRELEHQFQQAHRAVEDLQADLPAGQL
jgi:predicted RNase H-like HicB family nuclease